MKGYSNWYFTEKLALYNRVIDRIARDYKDGKITLHEKLEAEFELNSRR
jgi:hypothetical protein